MADSKTFPTDLTLQTTRCRLRHIDRADLPHIFDATRHPGFNDGMMWGPPAVMEDLLVPHLQNVEAWQAGTSWCFTIETRAERIFIGRIIIRRQYEGAGKIGYWIHPLQQGKGYAKEAAACVVRFGFEQLEMESISADHAVWNTASRRVLEHAGFSFVEHIPHGFTKRGEWVAEDRLAITRDEWVALGR